MGAPGKIMPDTLVGNLMAKRIWSGGTYDGYQVVFCDQDGPGFDGIIAALENGRVVVRSLGGTWFDSTSEADPETIVSWLDKTADRLLGAVSDSPATNV